MGGTQYNTIGPNNGALVDGSMSAGGIAVAGWGGTNPVQGLLDIEGNSTVKGSIRFNDHSNANIGPGSMLSAGPVINVGPNGTLTNNGTLQAGLGRMVTTMLTGNFVRGASGVPRVNANNRTGQADLLAVQSTAQLGGSVELHFINLTNRPVTVLTATGGATQGPAPVGSDPGYIFGYNTSVVGNAVQVQPTADFASAASGASRNGQRVAAYPQSVWSSGADLNGGFSALSTMNDPATFAGSLTNTAGVAAHSNNNRTGEANLERAPAGTGTFTVDSKPPTAVGKLKAGADFQVSDGPSVKLLYNASAAPGFVSQSLMARLSYAF